MKSFKCWNFFIAHLNRFYYFRNPNKSTIY